MLDIVWRINYKGIRKEAGRQIGKLAEDVGSLKSGWCLWPYHSECT